MRTNHQTNLINPASGAIIMSIGIFLYAAIDAFPLLNETFGQFFVILLIMITLVIYIPLNIQFFHKYFLFPLLNNPVNSFVMGTWIAGISVLCNVILKYFPSLDSLVFIISMINTILWFLFFISCVRNFVKLIKRPTTYSPHGIVLLSTVATQSLVISWVKINPSIPNVLVFIILAIGLLFYLIGIALISIHYNTNRGWSLINDWTNTNCIIHGALSISGLAMVNSNLIALHSLVYVWIVVFALVIIVETLEIFRAVKRIQQLGWKQGVFTYNSSQWSRNFTFGMFYAFTAALYQRPNLPNELHTIQEVFLAMWAWVVIILLLIEIYLFFHSKWNINYIKRLSV